MQNIWENLTFGFVTIVFIILIFINWGSRPRGVPSVSMFINVFFFLVYLLFVSMWGGIFWC
jgi:hypothetical protein